MIQTIRRAIDTKGNLRIPARDLAPRVNLYAAGLTPLAAIEVMIEIEQELRIVFPDQMLVRDSVASIEKIASCLPYRAGYGASSVDRLCPQRMRDADDGEFAEWHADARDHRRTSLRLDQVMDKPGRRRDEGPRQSRGRVQPGRARLQSTASFQHPWRRPMIAAVRV
jgi:acyl carrier protein